MKRICSNCGREFESKTHRQTCSTTCRYDRQREAIRQMREKSGEIYLRWHNKMFLGIASGKERGSKKKGGEK